MWRALYPLITGAASPLIGLLLRRRVARGREDPARLAERFGNASAARPEGPLVWIHGASVGECQSVRPLIEALTNADPRLNIVLTSMTLTAARLIARHPPPRTTHQFVPLDRAAWVDRFLDHWQPDMMLLVDTELWPNMIWRCAARGIPMMLVNGRMSARSERRWRWARGLIGDLLGRFDVIHGQSPAETDRFARLGATRTEFVGNLKFDARPPPADEQMVAALAESWGDRPRWIAASTHPGDEELALDAHATLSARFAGLLTVIAPRHPERGAELAAMIQERGLPVTRRALDQAPVSGAGVYLADTLGELGLFYRLCPVALVGGSFTGGTGGHNPIEPALLGCAVLHGPDMSSFAAVTETLAAAHGAMEVDGPYVSQVLAETLALLLADPARRDALAKAGAEASAAQQGASAILARRILERLAIKV